MLLPRRAWGPMATGMLRRGRCQTAERRPRPVFSFLGPRRKAREMHPPDSHLKHPVLQYKTNKTVKGHARMAQVPTYFISGRRIIWLCVGLSPAPNAMPMTPRFR